MFKRIFYIALGITAVVLGAYGRIPGHGVLPLWRRLAGAAFGLCYIYIGSMYYLPKYRRQREELSKLLDEAEREMDKIEGKSHAPK